MLKAENYIKCQDLKAWTAQWKEENYTHFFESIGDPSQKRRVRLSMEDTILNIKKSCENLPLPFDFKDYFQLLNPIILDCYFKSSHSSIHVANYYEEVLLPADPETYHRIFQASDEIGQMTLKTYSKVIGQIGECSDLFHLVFSRNEPLVDMPLTAEKWTQEALREAFDQQEFISLKLWNTADINQPIDTFIEFFLYHASTELNLHLKRVVFDRLHLPPVKPLPGEFNIGQRHLEPLPVLYFNSAGHNLSPTTLYFSYFHAIDYFSTYAMDLKTQKQLKLLWLSSDEEMADSFALDKSYESMHILQDAQRNALGWVLQDSVSLEAFQEWLQEHPLPENPHLPLINTQSESLFIHSLSQRIRTAIAYFKPQVRKSSADPIQNAWLRHEIPLMKWLSSEVISYWSQKLKYVYPQLQAHKSLDKTGEQG